jgi:hypothetical protein
VNWKEGWICADDFLASVQQRAGRDLLALDAAVRHEDLEAVEPEILEDRLGKAEEAALERVAVELAALEAIANGLQNGGVHRQSTGVLGHPRDFGAVLMGELEIVD